METLLVILTLVLLLALFITQRHIDHAEQRFGCGLIWPLLGIVFFGMLFFGFFAR